MEQQRRRRRNLAQNILITLLSLSAVMLFAQTQLISLNLPSGEAPAPAGPSPAAPAAPDVITVDKSIDYKCPLHGTDETKYHKQVVKVYPWIPYKGQFVLCLYIPRDDGDGFILGGI